ncbi:MAG: SDR family oxidoreductase [Lysobacteraceae bacterium]|nr:MAG: SDR family oxidoreductase [Xanthomonadaceae bacterium]
MDRNGLGTHAGQRREQVLITGASAGIGMELARCFAADRSTLILSARREAELQLLAAELRTKYEVEVHVLPADLADPSGVAALLSALTELGLSPDVLVNNAGFGARGHFAELAAGRIEGMLAVNVTAVTRLAHALLPSMRARRRGGILNVASTAAFQPGPYMAVYYATKAYVLSWSEALFEECRDEGVTVSALCPGPTHTEFSSVAGTDDTRLLKLGSMDAVTVARVGHAAFRAGKPLSIPGFNNRLGAFSVRFFPRALVRKLVTKLQK